MQDLVQSNISRSIRSRIHPLKIVAMGDSYVYGYGDVEGGGWADRLRRYWMQPDGAGHVLYNLGVRGNTVLQVEQRLETEFRARGELRDRLPNGLAISVGANDSARLGHRKGRNFVPFDEFEAAIARVLDNACSLCPVWFVGMVPVDETKMPFAGGFYYSHIDQLRYNDAARLACNARGIPFLNCFEIWQAKGELWQQARRLEDGLHPNSAGYRAVFEAILDWPELAQLNGKGERELAIA